MSGPLNNAKAPLRHVESWLGPWVGSVTQSPKKALKACARPFSRAVTTCEPMPICGATVQARCRHSPKKAENAHTSVPSTTYAVHDEDNEPMLTTAAGLTGSSATRAVKEL